MLAQFLGIACASIHAATVESTTDAFKLSIKHDGIRQSAGNEALAYSALWDGDANATVTIAQDGVALVECLTGEDTYAWGVTRNGTYVLTHTTYTNGVAGAVETATFVVTGKDVPFAQGDVTVSNYSNKYDGAAHGIMVASEIAGIAYKYASGASGATSPTGEWSTVAPTLTDVGSMTVWVEISAPGYITQTNSATVTVSKREVTLTSGSDSKVYDGTALVKHNVAVGGDGFVDGEGATCSYTGSQTNVGESANTFTYTLNAGTLAGNYDVEKVEGTLTVTKATIGPGGGDEPGGGDVPDGGESKFDVTAMYDGEGHTIDTNALVAAFGDVVIGAVAVEYAVDDGAGESGAPGAPALPWSVWAPVYANVGEYIVWYRVTNSNYEDFAHAAKVTITNRPVTVTSADGSWTYDGQSHSNAIVTAEGFVPGEGIIAGDFAEVVDVGTAPNAFAYAFAEGTLAGNYLVTCVTGTLSMVAADMGGWTDDAKWSVTLSGDGAKYDGTEKTCSVTAVAYDGFAIPTFTVSGNKATDAGDYTLTVTGTGNFSGSRTFPWSIVKRAVTLTSGSASKVYDGTALVKQEVTVGGDGFAAGEGATYEYTGSQTAAGTSKNAFAYTLKAGTLAGDYDITKVEGDLTVTPAAVNPADVFGGDDSAQPLVCEKVFNGEVQPVSLAPNLGESYSIRWALVSGDESAYSETPPTLRDVADGDLLVYFKFMPSNFEPYYGSVVFRIVPKTLTDDMVVLGDEVFFFDGQQKKPDVAYGDGDPSIITTDDFDVSFENNVNAGTATVTFTGKNNYAGTVTQEFEILKADNEWTTEPAIANWTYGQTPLEPVGAAKDGTPTVTYGTSGATRPTLPGDYVATFAVAESQNYNAIVTNVEFKIFAATINYVADNVSGEYNGAGYGIADTISVSTPATGAVVKYAVSAEGPWVESVMYTNACAATPIYFTIEAMGYMSVTNSCTVTITPKTLTENYVRLVPPAADYVYDGTAKVPDVACGDGDPSIITSDDFDVSFENNVNAGTATATFTGKNNYAGSVTENFSIQKASYDMNGVAWDYVDEFPYDGSVKTVSVSWLPSGVAVASYSGNTASLPGTYVAHATFTYDTLNYNEPTIADLEWKIKSAEESTLHDIFDDLPTEIGSDGDGGWTVKLTNDIYLTNGPIEMPDNLGHVTIDMNGYGIFGADGAPGDETTPGEDGKVAILIVPVVGNGDVTRLSLITTGGDARVKGGDGGDGTPGGNGAAAIKVADGARGGVKIDVGVGITVCGGDGGGSVSGRGGDGGSGIDGDVGTNGGTILGGDGGDSVDGDGGNGGHGVDGNVDENNGTISGGGSESASGRENPASVVAVYDGAGHGISVEVAHLPSGAVVRYARTAPGPFVDERPLFTNVVDAAETWYELSAGGVGPVTNMAMVTISPRSLATASLGSIQFQDVGGVRRPVPMLVDDLGHEVPPTNYDFAWTEEESGAMTLSFTGRGNYFGLFEKRLAQTRFHVTFDANGGTVDTDGTDYDIGTYYGVLPIPSRAGYLFGGWYEHADFSGGLVTRNTEVIAADLTLYAKWLRRVLWHTDAIFHLEAAATYDGYLIDPSAGGAVAGTIQVKAGKPNKNTGASKLTVVIQVAGQKKISVKGMTYDGLFKADAQSLDLMLGFSSMSGKLGRFEIDGSRNLFTAKDADSKLRAAQALNQWQGTYVVAWQDPGAAAKGWNGLSIVVGSKGKVTAKGALADGTKVSAKSQLLIGERECAAAVSWTKKGSSVACLAWFCEDGSVECGNLLGGASAKFADSRTGAYLASGAAFHVDVDALAAIVPGLNVDLVPDGLEVRMKGSAFDIDKSGKVKLLKDKSGIDPSVLGTNPSGLKLKYKMKESTFSGSFAAYFQAGGKLKKTPVQISGVVLDGIGYGTASVKKSGSVAVTIK